MSETSTAAASTATPSNRSDVRVTMAARSYSVAAGTLVAIISARWLGPSARGLVAAGVSWLLLVSSLGHLSLGPAAIRTATGRHPDTWLPRLASALVVMAAVVGGAIAIVMGGLFLAFGEALFAPLDWELMAIVIVGVPFYVLEQYAMAGLASSGRVRSYNRAQMAGRTLGLVGTVLVLVAGGGAEEVLLAVVLGQVLTSTAAAHRLAARVFRLRGALAEGIRLARLGLKLHANTIGSIALASADVVIVSHYAGARAGGLYQIASQFVYALLFLPQAAALALTRDLVALGPVRGWGKVRRPTVVTFFGVVAVAGLLALFAGPVVRLALGESYAGAAHLLAILTLAVPGMTASALMGPQWITRGWFVRATLVTVTVAAANVAANLALVPVHGATASAWIMAATGMAGLVVNLTVARLCERQWRAAEGGPDPGPP